MDDENEDPLITHALIRFYKPVEKAIVEISDVVRFDRRDKNTILEFEPRKKTDFVRDDYYYVKRKGDGKYHAAQMVMLGDSYQDVERRSQVGRLKIAPIKDAPDPLVFEEVPSVDKRANDTQTKKRSRNIVPPEVLEDRKRKKESDAKMTNHILLEYNRRKELVSQKNALNFEGNHTADKDDDSRAEKEVNQLQQDLKSEKEKNAKLMEMLLKYKTATQAKNKGIENGATVVKKPLIQQPLNKVAEHPCSSSHVSQNLPRLTDPNNFAVPSTSTSKQQPVEFLSPHNSFIFDFPEYADATEVAVAGKKDSSSLGGPLVSNQILVKKLLNTGNPSEVLNGTKKSLPKEANQENGDLPGNGNEENDDLPEGVNQKNGNLPAEAYQGNADLPEQADQRNDDPLRHGNQDDEIPRRREIVTNRENGNVQEEAHNEIGNRIEEANQGNGHPEEEVHPVRVEDLNAASFNEQQIVHEVVVEVLQDANPLIQEDPPIIEDPLLQDNPPLIEDHLLQDNPHLIEDPLLQDNPPLIEDPLLQDNPPLIEDPLLQDDPPLMEDPLLQDNPPLIEEPLLQDNPPEQPQAVDVEEPELFARTDEGVYMGGGRFMTSETYRHLSKKGESLFIKDLMTFFWTRQELRVRSLQPTKCRNDDRILLEQDRYNLMLACFKKFFGLDNPTTDEQRKKQNQALKRVRVYVGEKIKAVRNGFNAARAAHP